MITSDSTDWQSLPLAAPIKCVMSKILLVLSVLFAATNSTLAQTLPAVKERPRAREAGVNVGVLDPGQFNAITDVNGVLVGQTTIIRGDNVRTGVTAVLPHAGNIF